MKHPLQMTIIGIALALAGSSGSALAQPAHHYQYNRRPSRAYASRVVQNHGRIVGNRRTRLYYMAQNPNRLPARPNRIYFGTAAEARASGCRPAPGNAIPINPQLTWRQAKRHLPSIGTHHVPPPPPQEMQKPLAPPAGQQPAVTPTQPMPN